MKTKVANFFFSTRLTSIYFVLLIVSMGMGTFIETWYGINTARIWIYNAFWFELIFFLLGINFVGNIFRYKLFRKEKWAVLFMHLSFILILLHFKFYLSLHYDTTEISRYPYQKIWMGKSLSSPMGRLLH